MKSLLILSAALLSSTIAKAEDKPFMLPTGSYKQECWNSTVAKTNEEVYRYSTYSKGHVVAEQRSNGDYAEHSTYQEMENGAVIGSGSSSSVTKIKALGNNLFQVEIAGNHSFDSEQGLKTQSTKSVATVKVEGKSSQNITVKNNDQPEEKGISESSWMTLPDGRIVHQSYLRESKTINERSFIASNTTCINTPSKKK